MAEGKFGPERGFGEGMFADRGESVRALVEEVVQALIRSNPNSRIIPTTAATWPWGRAVANSMCSATGPTASPFNPNRRTSTRWSGNDDGFATIRDLTWFPSR